MAVDLRIQLIERVCRLPAELLPRVGSLLDELASPVTPVAAEPKLDVSIKPQYWPHAPMHLLDDTGTYFLTAATQYKQHLFRGAERLDLLQTTLLKLAKEYDVALEAWAVFSNHYHFVGYTLGTTNRIRDFVSHVHTETARELNVLDGKPGRDVWFNFWDSRLTFQASYLARLNYVHQNAVRHRLATVANQYRWCSAAWFERTATPAQVNTIYSFKTDTITVMDNFDPV